MKKNPLPTKSLPKSLRRKSVNTSILMMTSHMIHLSLTKMIPTKKNLSKAMIPFPMKKILSLMTKMNNPNLINKNEIEIKIKIIKTKTKKLKKGTKNMNQTKTIPSLTVKKNRFKSNTKTFNVLLVIFSNPNIWTKK